MMNRDDFDGYPEHAAVFNDDLNALLVALSSPLGDPNVLHHHGHSPLSLAVVLGRLQIASCLIDHGANIAQPTGAGVPPVCLAAAQSDDRLISLFIDKAHADLTLCDRDSASVCHYAAANANAHVMRLLIAHGCALNGRRGRSGFQPIHIAALNENDTVMRLLLTAGADVHSISIGGETPIHCAARNPNANVVKMLLKAGALVDTITWFGESTCHAAAANANDEVLATLIAAKASVSAVNRRGETPCLVACANPNEKVLNLLVDAGATLNLRMGTTLCHAAARNRNTAVLKRLIDVGMDVNARDVAKRTPLHDAAARGSVASLELLLEAGADLAAVDDRQRSACNYAAYNSDVSVLRVLLARGAAPDVISFGNAVDMNNVAAMHALVEAGFNVSDAVRASDCELVFDAVKCGREAKTAHALRFLLQRGANPLQFDNFDETPCHCASDAALTELFAFGASLSVAGRNDQKQLPSHCLSSDDDCLLTLIAAGADIESLDAAGESPVHDLSAKGAALVVAADGPRDDIDIVVPPRTLEWARHRIARRQFELLQQRALQICVGLAALELSALEMCEILSNMFAPRESQVAMHRVWTVVTTIRHWKK